MGTNNIPTATDGTVIPASDHNAVQEAMANDIVPRNTSGVATANQGDLGTSTYPFKGADITTGYFFTGQIISMHTYNGLLSPGHGWMKCDGTIINEANYNTEHGAGTWATYIGSSTIDGKYLPDFTGSKYPVGATSTTQTGAAPLTTVGNSNSQISVGTHTHTGPSHNHKWYDYLGADHDKVYNSGGSLIYVPTSTPSNNHIVFNVPSGVTGAKAPNADLYTSNAGTGNTGAGGSITNKNIQPESIEVVYYMRIK